jgi:hypothetical protein
MIPVKIKALTLRLNKEPDLSSGILFIAALLVYLSVALLINRHYITPDGRSYQRLAVNISENNVFSVSIEPPYERQFFREPGYPFVFSIACFLNRIAGNENKHFPYFDASPGYYDPGHTEIFILKLIHVIFAAFTVLFFFKIMTFFLPVPAALKIAILFLFYLPFSVYITFPQRELFLTFILMLMGYLAIRSAMGKNPVITDVLTGVLAAVLVLTLQVYLYILPFFLLSHILIARKLKKTIRSTLIIAVVFAAGVIPWALRGINEAGNIRAVKSFGTSYTYEFRKFHNVNALAYKLDLNNEGGRFIDIIVNEYGKPGKIMFERSFNGYYTNYSDSLAKVISLESKNMASVFFRENILKNGRKAMILPLWKPDYRKNISTLLSGKGRLPMIISITAGIIIAVIAVAGMILSLKRCWKFLPVFTFHLIMIPFIADEARRVLPFIPFYFMFFVLGIMASKKLILRQINLKPVA